MFIKNYDVWVLNENIVPYFLGYKSGPGCSKLMISLANVWLKCQMLISENCQNFLLKKCEKLLQCKNFSLYLINKNISVFGY